MKDKFFLGSIAGFTGAVVMVGLDYLLNLIPGIHTKFMFRVTSIFVPRGLTETLPGSIIGLIAHLTCGALMGLAILIVLEKTGYVYPLLKGAMVGFGLWFLLCGIFARALRIDLQEGFLDTILTMLIHIPFGVTAAWVINRYRYKPTV